MAYRKVDGRAELGGTLAVQAAELAQQRAAVAELKVRPLATYRGVDPRSGLGLGLAQQRAAVDHMKVPCRDLPGSRREVGVEAGAAARHGGQDEGAGTPCMPLIARACVIKGEWHAGCATS